MHSRRMRHVLAAAIALGPVALVPATASAHPEACADASFASMENVLAFEEWSDSYEVCMSDAAVSNFDDSGAQLAAGESAGTANLRHVFNRPKSAPFDDIV